MQEEFAHSVVLKAVVGEQIVGSVRARAASGVCAIELGDWSTKPGSRAIHEGDVYAGILQWLGAAYYLKGD
jgi:hypothetical protein